MTEISEAACPWCGETGHEVVTAYGGIPIMCCPTVPAELIITKDLG